MGNRAEAQKMGSNERWCATTWTLVHNEPWGHSANLNRCTCSAMWDTFIRTTPGTVHCRGGERVYPDGSFPFPPGKHLAQRLTSVVHLCHFSRHWETPKQALCSGSGRNWRLCCGWLSLGSGAKGTHRSLLTMWVAWVKQCRLWTRRQVRPKEYASRCVRYIP